MTKSNLNIKNKKAYFDYEILEKFEAGLVLSGVEVKSIRLSKANLKGSYVALLDLVPYVFQMHISEYTLRSDKTAYEPLARRRLLLNKKEILKLEKAEKTAGLTIIPLRLYLKKGLIKMEIAIVRGKKTVDKRDSLKEKTQNIDIKRALKRFT